MSSVHLLPLVRPTAACLCVIALPFAQMRALGLLIAPFTVGLAKIIIRLRHFFDASDNGLVILGVFLVQDDYAFAVFQIALQPLLVIDDLLQANPLLLIALVRVCLQSPVLVYLHT